jgi:hypothetical protein
MTPSITHTNNLETTDKNQTIKIAKQSEYSVDIFRSQSAMRRLKNNSSSSNIIGLNDSNPEK